MCLCKFNYSSSQFGPSAALATSQMLSGHMGLVATLLRAADRTFPSLEKILSDNHALAACQGGLRGCWSWSARGRGRRRGHCSL